MHVAVMRHWILAPSQQSFIHRMKLGSAAAFRAKGDAASRCRICAIRASGSRAICGPAHRWGRSSSAHN